MKFFPGSLARRRMQHDWEIPASQRAPFVRLRRQSGGLCHRPCPQNTARLDEAGSESGFPHHGGPLPPRGYNSVCRWKIWYVFVLTWRLHPGLEGRLHLWHKHRGIPVRSRRRCPHSFSFTAQKPIPPEPAPLSEFSR